MPDYLGDEIRKVKKNESEKEKTKEIKRMFKKNKKIVFSYTCMGLEIFLINHFLL